MALHLAVVLIFMKVTGSLLQAPGRVVSQVIAYLHEKHQTDISPGDFAILRDYHELVVKSFKEKRAIAKDRHDSESMEGVTDKHGEQEERGIQEASNKQGEQEAGDKQGEQEAGDKQGEQEAGDKQGEQEAGDKQGEQEERGKQEDGDKQEVKDEPEIEMVEEISEVETSDLPTRTELMDRLDRVKETAMKYMSKGGRAGEKSDHH